MITMAMIGKVLRMHRRDKRSVREIVKATSLGEWPNLWASPMRADKPTELVRIACLAGTSA